MSDHNSFKIQMSTSQDVRDLKVCLAHCCSRYTGTLPYWRIYPSSHRLLLTVPSHCHYETVTSRTVLSSLTKTFSMFGYPHGVASDNGPQFISEEFSEYMQQHDIEHR